MLWQKSVNLNNAVEICDKLILAWKNDANKVFVLRAEEKLDNVRDHYEKLFTRLGVPAYLAEDVNLGDRENQRTGQIWMEVRYDSRFPNAYRHSPNAQPLHTDGSYIASFPNASLLACVANTGVGGETTFLNGADLIGSLKCEAPDLLDKLINIDVDHARSGDRRNGPIIRCTGSGIKLYWNYYCVAKDAPSSARELAERFHNYLLESHIIKVKTVPIKLMPGDAVLWKDDEILHGRNSFEANRESERFLWKCAFDVGNFARE